MSAMTLYDKLWDAHVVRYDADGTALLYIDRQLVHEVTSPQAFEGLRLAGRKPWRINANLATPDHNVPTTKRPNGLEDIVDPVARVQVETLDANCAEFGLTEFHINDIRQGIVHVVGPEQGATWRCGNRRRPPSYPAGSRPAPDRPHALCPGGCR